MSLLFSTGTPATEDGAVGDVCVDIEKADEMRLRVFTKSVGTKQVITATAAGTVGAAGAGNITLTVTCVGMTGSPKAVSCAVANDDTPTIWAGKARAALAADTDVAAKFTIGGSGVSIVLTRKDEAANDATMNLAIAAGTATGPTAAPTATQTTAGVEEAYASVVPVCHAQIRKGPGAPLAVTGQNGDVWHDTAADEWYGPKAAGVWGEDAAVDIED